MLLAFATYGDNGTRSIAARTTIPPITVYCAYVSDTISVQKNIVNNVTFVPNLQMQIGLRLHFARYSVGLFGLIRLWLIASFLAYFLDIGLRRFCWEFLFEDFVDESDTKEYRAISMSMIMVKFFDYSETSINNATDIRRSKAYLEFLRLIGSVIN